MIRLINEPVSLTSWTSPTYSTSSSLTSGTTRVISHPLGRKPDHIKAVLLANNEVVFSYSFNAAINSDIQHRGIRITEVSNTSVTIITYRQNSSASNIRFTFYLLGDTEI